jgi:hypothetical protein
MNRTPLIPDIVGIIPLVAMLDFWTSAEFVGSILSSFSLVLCAMQRFQVAARGTTAAAILLTIAKPNRLSVATFTAFFLQKTSTGAGRRRHSD